MSHVKEQEGAREQTKAFAITALPLAKDDGVKLVFWCRLKHRPMSH